ncbi:hypothetical protein GCM10010326_14050 [Streptomyces xanthochromogenes]|uniref:Uncharacterized protein n=1 Tax=Streptomyces xanthochromogenes TaxID=67384 RepID=A0ABQ2ZPS9_9ACTN|nr:hypothetical protein GCM10010326_14050 [Streptomyces xanthochromogenes]
MASGQPTAAPATTAPARRTSTLAAARSLVQGTSRKAGELAAPSRAAHPPVPRNVGAELGADVGEGVLSATGPPPRHPTTTSTNRHTNPAQRNVCILPP